MADTLKFEIVTPEGMFHSQDVLMVTLPAVEGRIGILPHQVQLTTQLVPGQITVHTGTDDKFLIVGEGMVVVDADHVTIMTDKAIPVDRSERTTPRRAAPAVMRSLADFQRRRRRRA